MFEEGSRIAARDACRRDAEDGYEHRKPERASYGNHRLGHSGRCAGLVPLDRGQRRGGMVEATADGRGRIRRIRIDPGVAKDGDVEMLEDLVLAAVADAQRRAGEPYRDEVPKGNRGGAPPVPVALRGRGGPR